MSAVVEQDLNLPPSQVDIDVSQLINGIRSVNIDFRLPKFEGNSRENSKEFLVFKFPMI